MVQKVGFVGLGIMGGAMSANMLKKGFDVVGFDVSDAMVERFTRAGGTALGSPGAVAEAATIVVLSLPSAAAFLDVVQAIADSKATGVIVVDTCTLTLDQKEEGRKTLETAGHVLLDCPLSGTGQQAQTGDLVVLASGDKAAYEACVPAFEGFSRANVYVGPFGHGSKMKFVANHLVNIHNVAAAEAMVLGMKAGLDPQVIYDVIADSAGTSRMFQVRGKLMAADDYGEAGMKISVWQKDLKVITEFAASVHCPTPLFAAAAQPYYAAMEQGLENEDTAAVCRVFEEAARVKRG
jgi:3-hydroxyisobutyrate dehydrogenase-like beta-hydroxyacid dehydrogenase